jgi:hypothetical protein
MNNNITHRQVMDRARNRIEPPPMATYCEPSHRAIIRARDQQAGQREARERREAMALLRELEPEEWLPQCDKEPVPELEDPVFNADFIAGLIAGLIASVLFNVIVAGALILGDRL